MNPLQPRLLADFAAVPTRRERNGTRQWWRSQQPSMFADGVEPDGAPFCPVCAGYHTEHDCPHGTAPTLLGDGPASIEPEHEDHAPPCPCPRCVEHDDAHDRMCDRIGRCRGAGRPTINSHCVECGRAVRTRTDGNAEAHPA